MAAVRINRTDNKAMVLEFANHEEALNHVKSRDKGKRVAYTGDKKYITVNEVIRWQVEVVKYE